MELSRISGSSAYDDQLKQLQLQEDKKAAEQEKTEQAQAAVAANAVSGTQNETSTGDTPQNVDTIEISAEGRAYQQNMQAASIPANQTTTTETTSSEEANASTVLTNLTEEEISQLVDDGTITQAEADAELARREALKESDENLANTKENNETVSVTEEDS